ncbi:MAG TPA: hypothetical protein PLJ21_00975 [Pseudobdellovibrionaceae bacterium]|nr:hypothetical protein [Pseudobdellovibrionaceae bacterium]
MGLVEKMKTMGDHLEREATQSFFSIIRNFAILVSGLFIGLTFGFIGQVLFSYGNFILIFITLMTLGVVYKLLSRWSITQILIFDLIVILIGALLRMYILVAP